MNRLRLLPAHLVNGIAVALGVGLIQLVIGVGAGALAAQLALSGAVCTSLADVPNTVTRGWNRLWAAAVLGFGATLVVRLLAPYPLALGGGVAAIAFVAAMAMAWGLRAGAVSFAPVLALVFTMALPADRPALHLVMGWQAAGSVAYIAWALLAAALLQRRYRALAVAAAVRAMAALLRARADLLAPPEAAETGGVAAMQAWVQGEAALADRLQAARDLVFAAPEGVRARIETAVVLRTIDMRDVLLASRLDLDLLGADDAGRWVLQRMAQALRERGASLDAAADALRDGTRPPPPPAWDVGPLFEQAPLAADDVRSRLLPVLAVRLREIDRGVERIHAMLQGEREAVPLTRAELQRFVAPDGWPMRALRTEARLSSPVLRHALRSALALSSAYFIARALPWASHPHWLVLSVAVVLRGNLEQTLSRRNARVLGTLLGCFVVLALAGTRSAPLQALAFLAAVGIAHSFVNQRYWLAASAATVMALLQSHLVHPEAGFAVAERAADTLLGALLAWGFSYVLPSWERRTLPAAVRRVTAALDSYAGHVLRPHAADAVEQRLARRRAYDALGAMAAALQRSAVEPRAVRVPVREVAALIDHGQRLMAHLSLVRLTLTQWDAAGATAPAALALQQARAELGGALALGRAGVGGPGVGPGAGPGAGPAGGEGASAAGTVGAEAQSGLAPDPGTDPTETALLPSAPLADDVLPWLQRRLQVLVHDARQVRRAAVAAMAGSR